MTIFLKSLFGVLSMLALLLVWGGGSIAIAQPDDAVTGDAPRVLYIEGESRRAHYLHRALQGTPGGIDVEVRAGGGLPSTIEDAAQFDAIILSGTSIVDQKMNRTNISVAQLQVLDAYVRLQGGGLVIVGGEQTFLANGYGQSLIEALSPVSFLVTEETVSEPSCVALVIDSSGSMAGQKMVLAKAAAEAVVDSLSEESELTVIGFDSAPQTYVPRMRVKMSARIKDGIKKIEAAGGTDIEPALEAAYLGVMGSAHARKHVILLSDGQSSYGSIAALAEQMKDDGVTVSTVAVGADTDMILLRLIASRASGRAYFTDDPLGIPRIFLQEIAIASSTAVIEGAFQPQVAKPHAMIDGLDVSSAPALLGLVQTTPKLGAEVVLTAPESGAPLLATWTIGEGRVTVFTSDVKGHWSAEWVSNAPFFSAFWQQVVGHTARAATR